MLRLRAVSALSFLAMTSLLARPAAAEQSTGTLPIALELSRCEGLDQSELLKLLAIEFQTLGVTSATPLEHVQIACGADEARVTLVAAGASNRVDLAATAPAAWPRLLALSVSELVIEARARVVPRSEPAPPAAAPARAPDVRPVLTPESVRRVRVFAGVTLRRAVRPATWLAGPQLGAEFDALPNLSLTADARLELGRTHTDLADVSWASARGALGALIGGRIQRLRLGLGPGLCLGYLRLSPTLNVAHATAHSVGGAWGGPQLVARAAFELSARWYVAASVDAGVVAWPVSGVASDGRLLLDGGGAWLSGAAALGAQF